MTSFLITAVLIASALQVRAEDRIAVAIFAAPMAVHEWVGPNLDGWGYYLSAGIFAFLALQMLLIVGSALAKALADASFVSIFLNFFGWCLWVTYQDPSPYNFLFVAYYIWVLSLLLRKGRLACGRRRNGSARYSHFVQ